MKYKNLILLGTSHIAKESVEEVEHTILNKDPDIIAVELDKRRFIALMHKGKRGIRFRDIFELGLSGFLFQIVGAFVEERLGRYVGVKPGSEMMMAMKLAREKKKKLALIDQDIKITLRRFSQEFRWKEKWSLFKDLVASLFGVRKMVPFDLTTVPKKSVISKLMKEVKVKYPGIYKALIEERNLVMARNLANIMKTHPDELVFAAVGAGHEKEIKDLVKNYLNA